MIRAAVAKLHETGISAEDYENARRSVYGDIAYSYDSPAAIASEVINSVLTGRGISEASDIIASITLSDVNERLKEQLDPENCCLSVILPLD